MRLAIFDLDETILSRDSDAMWFEYLVENQLVDPKEVLPKREALSQAYDRGEYDFPQYADLALSPVLHLPLDELHALRDDYLITKSLPAVQPKAQAAIEAHRQMGDLCLIITATLNFLVEPLGKHLGMHHVMGTELHHIENKPTSKILGTPTFQKGKVSRLMDWLDSKPYSLSGSHFYSDSFNDVPLLETVDHPFVVDPDPRLRAHAEAKGWPIVSFQSLEETSSVTP